eukprot:15434214-Alexandrium_andersonii.AAC.1
MCALGCPLVNPSCGAAPVDQCLTCTDRPILCDANRSQQFAIVWQQENYLEKKFISGPPVHAWAEAPQGPWGCHAGIQRRAQETFANRVANRRKLLRAVGG